jgi:hypothetical protein
VHNTTDCVSINHNWLNAANARVCWAMLRDELDDVRSGLPDADDRSDGVLCQSLLLRREGADFATFAGILAAAARRCVRAIRAERQEDESADPASSTCDEKVGAKRKRDGKVWSGEHQWSLGVAVGLLWEVLGLDPDGLEGEGPDPKGGDEYPGAEVVMAGGGGGVVVSGWEEREDELEAARAAADDGEDLLAELHEERDDVGTPEPMTDEEKVAAHKLHGKVMRSYLPRDRPRRTGRS